VGHDWMLASASVMALASFGLLPQLLCGSSRCTGTSWIPDFEPNSQPTKG
jgi:hypothetical protein